MRPLATFSGLVVLGACAAARAPHAAALAPTPHDVPHDPAGHHHGPGHAGEHGPGHFADPERFVAAWNSPERDAWQKPDEIVAALGVSPGATVVDLGAGTGYLLPPLSRAVGPSGEVIALEVEAAMIGFIDEAAKREGWTNVHTHAGAYDDPKLPPQSVDAVVTLNVWHHVSERPAYASRVLATLKPGGAFVIVDFLKERTEGFGPPMDMRLTADDVAADLRAGGFEVDLVEETLPRHYIVRGRRPAR
jgi:predicted methyltransferase